MTRFGSFLLGLILLCLSTILLKLHVVYGVGIQLENARDTHEWVLGWMLLAAVYVVVPIMGICYLHKAFNPPKQK